LELGSIKASRNSNYDPSITSKCKSNPISIQIGAGLVLNRSFYHRIVNDKNENLSYDIAAGSVPTKTKGLSRSKPRGQVKGMLTKLLVGAGIWRNFDGVLMKILIKLRRDLNYRRIYIKLFIQG
jgi:hypothetical protein